MTTGTVLLEFGEPTVPDEDRGLPIPYDDEHVTVLRDLVEPTVAGTEPDSDDFRPGECTGTRDAPCLSCTSEP